MRRGQVKKSMQSLSADDRGASLIAVVITAVFVLTIAAIVTEVTTTNIRMREIEQSGKRNFYNAEAVMDELKDRMAVFAAEKIQECYAEILSRYGTIADQNGDLQTELGKLYLKKLDEYFYDNEKENNRKTDYYDYGSDGTPIIIYKAGYYNPGQVEALFSPGEAENGAWSYMWPQESETADESEDNLYFTIDYAEGLYTLKNLKIRFWDGRGYGTWISTDLVFHTPKVPFDGNAFMDYALIADKKIQVNAGQVSVTGSIYAGADGIEKGIDSGVAIFVGENIVTRGDIVVGGDSTLILGDGTTHIWAENVITKRGEGNSALTMNGEINIADDLELTGNYSKVTLRGTYNGYNFRPDYAEEVTGYQPKDSAFSSAIMINGESCKLDLSEIDHLFLAGRTYISRGRKGSSTNDDIPMGESLSVRSNQLAYYVNEKYLESVDGTQVNMRFTVESEQEYQKMTGVENVTQYLDGNQPVVVYWYIGDSGVPSPRYYLNFRSEGDANKFFATYWNEENREKFGEYGTDYAEAIVLNPDDPDVMLDLSGNLVYRNGSGTLQLEEATVAPEDWEDYWGIDKKYWVWSDKLARRYKSLENNLTDNYSEVKSDDVRFYETEIGEIKIVNKSVDPLLENILDMDAIMAAITKLEGKDSTELERLYNKGRKLILVNDSSYTISNQNGIEGIVIATGDVTVMDTDFVGMIISGGTISFTAGAKVTGSPAIVAEMFEEDIKKGDDSLFAQYFYDYMPPSGMAVNSTRIKDYLTYENWTKNEE